MRKLASLATATALLATGLLSAGSASAVVPADDIACPAVTVNLPEVVVLTQSNTLTHPTVSTECSLSFLSFDVYTPTSAVVDFLDWDQDPIVNGDPTNWTIYASNYTPGVTYHSDNAEVTDTNYQNVTLSPMSFLVKDGSRVVKQSTALVATRHYRIVHATKVVKRLRWVTIKRHGKKVRVKRLVNVRIKVTKKILVKITRTLTINGTSSQFSEAADYGLGAVVAAPEAVQVQKLEGATWKTVAAASSTAAGKFSKTVGWTARGHYRLVIPGTKAVAPSMSAPFIA